MTITVTLADTEDVTRILGAIAEDHYHGDLDAMIGDLKDWEDAFIGTFPTPEDFVAAQLEILELDGIRMPRWVVEDDHRATWERALRHDYWVFEGIHYFCKW